MNDATRARIVSEVAALTRPPILEEDEFTRTDYMTETGLGHSAATNALKGLVDAGRLGSRLVFDPRTRRQVTAYRFTAQSDPGGQVRADRVR